MVEKPTMNINLIDHIRRYVDLNKIEALLKQVKGPNGEDLDIQITPGQINYEYEICSKHFGDHW